MEIAVFLTGGTISMSQTDSGVAPGGGLGKLLKSFPSLKDISIRYIAWSDKPSPHMTLENMLHLSQDVDNLLQEDTIHGAVILHGTDLLAETAFVLDSTVSSQKPIVLTGAMRHMGEEGYDGIRNLISSIMACLIMPNSSESLVQMADFIFTARDVVKIDSLSSIPFVGQCRGSVGRIVGEQVIFNHNTVTQRPRLPLPQKELKCFIPILTCFPGMVESDFDWLYSFLQKDTLHGIVLEGFGAGNAPPGVVPLVRKLLDKDIPVILTTRCLYGGVTPTYSYEGGGAQLINYGVVSAGSLSSIKAQLLLKVALSCGFPCDKLSELFEEAGGSKKI